MKFLPKNPYKVAKKRWNSPFSKPTLIDFLSAISKERDFDSSIEIISYVIGGIIVYYTGLAWWWIFILAAVLFGILTLSIAIIDTYNMYKYRVRQSMMKTIKHILEMGKKHG